jgi:manganese/zinc/iron transport system ATP- binding protein
MKPLRDVTPEAAIGPLPLAVEGLSVAYGDTIVVDGVDAAFPAGTMTAIVGPATGGRA